MTVDELRALLESSTDDIVNISETVFVADGNHIDLDGRTIFSTADPAIAVDGKRWSIRNGRFRADGGVCIDLVKASIGHVSGMFLESGSPDKEIVRCIGDGQCYDTLFQACELAHSPNMTVPIVRVSVDGNYYNSNSWQNIRFQTNGAPQAPCVVLECNAGTWLWANSFRDINGERPNAGLIHCRGCSGTILENVVVYDTHLGNGSVSDDVLFFGRVSGKLKCDRTTIRNYSRLEGNLDAGKYDINMADHYSTAYLEQISGTSSRLRVICRVATTRVNVQDFRTIWENV